MLVARFDLGTATNPTRLCTLVAANVTYEDPHSGDGHSYVWLLDEPRSPFTESKRVYGILRGWNRGQGASALFTEIMKAAVAADGQEPDLPDRVRGTLRLLMMDLEKIKAEHEPREPTDDP